MDELLEGYICDICGKASIDIDEMKTHKQLLVKDWGFKGGELLSYGPGHGSGTDIAVILEPSYIDENHVQRYSCLGLLLLNNPHQIRAEMNHISGAGFPPNEKLLIPHKMGQARYERDVQWMKKNNRRYITELDDEKYEIAVDLLTAKEVDHKHIWPCSIEMFGDHPNEHQSKIEYSVLDVIQKFYPHITSFSKGRLREKIPHFL